MQATPQHQRVEEVIKAQAQTLTNVNGIEYRTNENGKNTTKNKEARRKI